jgi:DNA-binding response OmpR family regulator
MQILLVEDDRALAEGLVKALSEAGLSVNHLNQGRLAIAAVETALPDMLILDLGLPDIDGIEVLKAVRKLSPDLPILLLTARATIEDKVVGLDHGADDYLAKPFDVAELLARIRTFERRASTFKHATLSFKNVTLDTAGHKVFVDGNNVSLSRREYMLLKMMMENVDRVQTKDSLEVKLYSWGEEVASNTIEVHIHHLRKKLPADFITTLRGIGYIINSS